jgi:hypothetical protein
MGAFYERSLWITKSFFVKVPRLAPQAARSGHMEPSGPKKQHRKVLVLSEVTPFISAPSGTPSEP